MNKQCTQCSRTFQIVAADTDFYARVRVPAPLLCPDCRAQRRLTVRNHWNYYRRSCDHCQKSIISVYDPATTQNVFCSCCWWGDQWNASDYGQDFDFSKTLAEQFKALHQAVPKLALMNDDGIHSVNSEYSNDFNFGKNVYMVVAAWYDENCLYGYQMNHCKDCVDGTHLFESELTYDCSASWKLYDCQHCHDVSDSRSCIFGYDLRNCHDCILSAGLRNKSYCIWNIQYTPEEYERIKKTLKLDSWEGRQQLRTEFEKFLLKIPRKPANLSNCADSSGNWLRNCSNAQYCFEFPDIQNGKYLVSGDGAKDSYDLYCTGHCELCYDSLTCDDSYHVLFSNNCWKCQEIYYSDNCHSSNNLFSCIGIKKGSYQILNKPYSQSNYETLKQKIITHLQTTNEWGYFLDARATLFAYNETAAQDYYPLNKNAAVQLGYQWKEPTIKEIAAGALTCTQCSLSYKIIPAELQFYQKHGIPVPKLCRACRHNHRRSRMGPHTLWNRQCMCTQTDHGHAGRCVVEFETTYSPNRKEIVYCEGCYKKEVY